MKKQTLIIPAAVSILFCLNVYANKPISTSTQEVKQEMKPSTEAKEISAGEKFLEENKKAKGVVTLPSGLQYKILTEGKGAKPGKNDTVTVHYSGTLINGKEFDSSYKRNEPATFPVSGVIAGWTEALQLMNTGSTWELYIPANLAYGEQGFPPVIGSNEVLIFKVELIGVKQ